MKHYKKALEEILSAFNVFYNFCPQKELGGASPFKKSKELEQKGTPPDPILSRSEFPPLGWGRKYHKALVYMKKAEFEKALKKFNEVFVYLLKNKTTCPDIFRLYANKGVCHLALGDDKLGEFMLETSAQINPFYDFSQQQLKRCREGKRLFKMRKGKERQDTTKDSAWRYYQFLKPFNINFVHRLNESASITVIDTNSVKRAR